MSKKSEALKIYLEYKNDPKNILTECLESLTDPKEKYPFTGKEFKEDLIANIHQISEGIGWGKVEKFTPQYKTYFAHKRCSVDLLILHTDKTGTVIECHTDKHLPEAIGRLLTFGLAVEEKFRVAMRLVLCAPDIPISIYKMIKHFNLPIRILQINKDVCTYLG
ncbi:MAG TPA: hypothetical protein PKY82_01860 [Pyrinomonadaceae bacterium]|nr:hypothetical protein [Pyrinomonadaceae bacterium]